MSDESGGGVFWGRGAGGLGAGGLGERKTELLGIGESRREGGWAVE
jgi:hypothetical protein